MKLNIYNKKEIVKTYEANSYELMYGTVIDLIKLVDLEKLKSEDDNAIAEAVVKLATNGIDLINPLLQDVFDGLTEEELRNTKISEIIKVVVDILKFAITQINKGNNSKN